jgi:methyl-accepting chemotaxis protein
VTVGFAQTPGLAAARLWRRAAVRRAAPLTAALTALLTAALANRQLRWLGGALALLLALRGLPEPVLQGMDALLGRSGDGLWLAGILLLAALWLGLLFQTAGRAPAAAQATDAGLLPAALQQLLDTHLQLDHEMDNKLGEVIQDTENSALHIMQEVRGLFDTADALVQYLNSSSPQAHALGQDIVNSMAYLLDIGKFIQELPIQMARDLDGVKNVVAEIKQLSGLVGSVQAISIQSHLLAINAAIEGSRAGPSGAAFRVVAQEMRVLAANSNAVALQINDGLRRAREVVEGGMEQRIAESSQALSDVTVTAASIEKLQDNFADMSQYFKTRFAVVTQHNQDLVNDIAEVLGHIQYQDVVSQCITRMRVATAQRNEFFQTLVVDVGQRQGLSQSEREVDLGRLAEQLVLISSNYCLEEDKHKHSARHDEDGSGGLKLELF